MKPFGGIALHGDYLRSELHWLLERLRSQDEPSAITNTFQSGKNCGYALDYSLDALIHYPPRGCIHIFRSADRLDASLIGENKSAFRNERSVLIQKHHFQ